MNKDWIKFKRRTHHGVTNGATLDKNGIFHISVSARENLKWKPGQSVDLYYNPACKLIGIKPVEGDDGSYKLALGGGKPADKRNGGLRIFVKAMIAENKIELPKETGSIKGTLVWNEELGLAIFALPDSKPLAKPSKKTSDYGV